MVYTNCNFALRFNFNILLLVDIVCNLGLRAALIILVEVCSTKIMVSIYVLNEADFQEKNYFRVKKCYINTIEFYS